MQKYWIKHTNQRTEGPERHSNVHLMIVVQVAAKFKKNKQFSNKGHGWNYCFECNKKQHYYWIMLENIVSVSCWSQIAFDRWPCKWIRIIFSSVNMCTKLEKDTLYGVHKVIPKRANNDLWPLKINKGCPLIMDNIYFIPDSVIWKGRI